MTRAGLHEPHLVAVRPGSVTPLGEPADHEVDEVQLPGAQRPAGNEVLKGCGRGLPVETDKGTDEQPEAGRLLKTGHRDQLLRLQPRWSVSRDSTTTMSLPLNLSHQGRRRPRDARAATASANVSAIFRFTGGSPSSSQHGGLLRSAVDTSSARAVRSSS